MITKPFIYYGDLMTNNSINQRKTCCVLLLTPLLLLSIIGQISHASTITSSRDYWPTTGWKTSIPEEQGMDSNKLDQMIKHIDNQNYAIDSVVVIKGGYIVLEKYHNTQYNQNTKHVCYSVTKSFTSSVMGIVMKEGFVESVDQKVLDFFPDRTFTNFDLRKQSITLEHLLTMTMGVEWDESTYPYMDSQGNADFRNSYIQMLYSDDFVQFVLDLPMTHGPGTKWVYNGGASHLLSVIIQQTTRSNTFNVAKKFLFGPLGISDVDWRQDSHGVTRGGDGLYLTPRDMAKFGFLFLNNGTWDAVQVISPEWVTKSSESFLIRAGPYDFGNFTDIFGGYGYQWWTLPPTKVYYALGLYRQRIIVVPKYDLVVVFTADIKNYPDPVELNLLFEYIIPAVIGDSVTVSELEHFMVPELVALIAPILFGVRIKER